MTSATRRFFLIRLGALVLLLACLAASMWQAGGERTAFVVLAWIFFGVIVIVRVAEALSEHRRGRTGEAWSQLLGIVAILAVVVGFTLFGR